MTKVAAMAAELDALAKDRPEMFGLDGHPKPKSAAAKLRTELQDAAPSRRQQLPSGADERVDQRERALARLVRDNCVELARREWFASVAAVERVRELVGEMLQAIGQVQAAEPRLLAIVNAVGAPYDGRSVLVDSRWQDLAEALASVGSWYPARVPGFPPFEDEQPNVVRTATGGWIRSKVCRPDRVAPRAAAEGGTAT